jgi:hypothetical protein
MKNAGILFFIVIIVSASTIGCGGEEETRNTAPVVNSFLTNPVIVNVNNKTTLTVSATDAEGDTLIYTYQPSEGTRRHYNWNWKHCDVDCSLSAG